MDYQKGIRKSKPSGRVWHRDTLYHPKLDKLRKKSAFDKDAWLELSYHPKNGQR